MPRRVLETSLTCRGAQHGLAALLALAMSACAPGAEDIQVPDDPDAPAAIQPIEVQLATAWSTTTVDLGPVGRADPGRPFAWVDGTRHVQVDADGLAWMHDEHASDRVQLAPATAVGATWLPDGSTLLALDGKLAVWDGMSLRDSPLQDAMVFPTESLFAGPYARWLSGAGRLVRLSDGRATELVVADRTLHGWAVSPSGTVWLAIPELVEVDGLDAGFAVTDHQPVAVRDLAVDRSGVVWAVQDEGSLLARNAEGSWARFVLADRAVSLAGRFDVDAVWIRTDAGALVHRAGTFAPAAVPEGQWLGLDEVGRLLVHDGERVQRVSLGLPTAFTGLRPGGTLAGRTRVGLVPTPDATPPVVLSAWLDDRALPVDSDPLAVELDPADLDTGEHLLRVVRRSQDTVHVSALPFRIGELPGATWDDDIAPLSQAHCAGCHAGASLTVLRDKEQWRARIEDIVDQVSDGAMPLGGPALSPDDIARIRGWQLGGFP